MEVCVVGAGIAGLTAAAAYARLGDEVVIYERPDAATAGAGTSLFGKRFARRNTLMRLIPAGSVARAAARVQAWRPPSTGLG